MFEAHDFKEIRRGVFKLRLYVSRIGLKEACACCAAAGEVQRHFAGRITRSLQCASCFATGQVNPLENVRLPFCDRKRVKTSLIVDHDMESLINQLNSQVDGRACPLLERPSFVELCR
jgi:hypothetical protein